MIVEFAYEDGWKHYECVMIKQNNIGEVKTHGNAYHVANSNWHSIHHPISEDMLKTGKNIPDITT